MDILEPKYTHAPSASEQRHCYQLSSYVNVWVTAVKPRSTDQIADLQFVFGYRCDPDETNYIKAVNTGISLGMAEIVSLYALASLDRRIDLCVPITHEWSREIKFELTISKTPTGGRKFEIKQKENFIRVPYSSFKLLLDTIEPHFESALRLYSEVRHLIPVSVSFSERLSVL